MHRLDRVIGAVALGFGCESGDEEGRHQGAAERDQRNCPWAIESRRPSPAAVPGGLRLHVAAEGAEEKLTGVLESEKENHRTEAGDSADRYPEDQPLLQITGFAYEGTDSATC